MDGTANPRKTTNNPVVISRMVVAQTWTRLEKDF